MKKNRITWIAAWAGLVALLIIMPGFEVRGLAAGLFPGYLPFLFYGELAPLATLSIMLVLCWALVCGCSFLMDKSGQGYRWYLAAVLAAMLAGAVFFAFNGMDYAGWQSTVEVQARETGTTMWEYQKKILIPRTVAGALNGLYAGCAACALASAIALVKRRKHTASREKA